MTPAPPHRRILVIDDDPALSEMLTILLEDEGYHVTVAPNGKVALQELSTIAQPCAILLDLNMPTMTGWEFRRVQQTIADIEQIPVFVISADRSLAQEPYTIDADAYFRKPIDIDRLLMLLEERCDGPG